MILNDEQLEFVNSPLENAKLLGIPGGGKTTTIIHKIFKLFENKLLISKGEFLVTTFGKKASKDFSDRGNELCKHNKIKIDNMFNKDNVKTFHSLAGSIIQTILGRSCTSLQIAIVSAINVIKTTDAKTLQKLKCLKNLKIIFVDEAQDMSDLQYELITLIKDKLQVKLVLIGDPNQNIYQFQNGSDKYLLEYGGRQYYLKKNNRSSPEITKFINHFRPWNYKIPPMESSTNETNIKPIVFCGTQEEICTKIYNEVKNSKIPKEKIAIIGPVKKSDNKDEEDSIKFGLQKITNMFTKKKINFVKHYNDRTKDDDYVNLEIPIKEGHVNIYTIHGSKGLEFDKVIIVNFHFKTFGKIPSIEEYNELKYLWYVALSRAKIELLICCNTGKTCWNELKYCPESLYKTSGDDLILRDPKFSSKNLCNMYIPEIVINKKIFNEDILMKCYKDINFTEEKEIIYKIDLLQNDLVSANQGLVSQFIKGVTEYYYCLFHNKEVKFINEIKDFFKNVVYVDKKYKNVLPSFRDKCGLDLMTTTTITHLKNIKILFNKEEVRLYEYILKKLNDDEKSNFSLAFENDDIYMNSKKINEICDSIFVYKSDYDLHWDIFKLCLFKYQYENEAKYLWKNKNNFGEIPNILSNHLKKIRHIALFLNDNYSFKQKCFHPNLKTNGTIDMISDDGSIIMIKFSDDVDITDKIKLFLYYHSYYYKWEKRKVVEIWNFKTGKRHIYEFEPKKSNFSFSASIAYLCKVKLYDTIFVYDLETTGIDIKKCDILERYVHEITHDIQYSHGIIKAKFKVPQIITDLTGISQKEVNRGEDVSIFKNEMQNLLDICYMPIFIAHNGHAFDHQIMRRLQLLNNNCRFLDSKSIIGQLSKEKTGGETLSKTYEIILGHKYKGKAHRAKADVIMLLEIFNELNVSEEDFLRLV